MELIIAKNVNSNRENHIVTLEKLQFLVIQQNKHCRNTRDFEQSVRHRYRRHCYWDLQTLIRQQFKMQRQPPRGVPRKRCSENMQQIYRRTPVQVRFQ